MAKIKTINGRPNPLASNAEKDSEAYGLKWAEHIYYDWYESDGNRYEARRDQFLKERSYVNNTVDISKFKDILSINKDKSWVALDWTMLPIVSKFVNTIVDGFQYDLFKVKARGIDPISIKQREEYRTDVEDKMLSQDFMAQFNQQMGIQNFDDKPLPESQEELDIMMDLEYKLDKEITAEIITDKVLTFNDWKETYNRVVQDLTTHKIGATKNDIDSQIGIKQLYVDPIDLLYSYDPYKTRDKRGCFYFAELRTYQIEDIKNQSNGKFSNEQLVEMAISSNDDYRRMFKEDEQGFKDNILSLDIDVMKFCFKTTRNEVYKEKYKGKLIPKDDSWELHPDAKSKKIQGSYDVWYEGVWILGTKYIYNYQLMSNMIRDPQDINKVLPPYTVYEINTPSIVSTIVPYADQMQIARLKIQHLMATAKPQGVAIDVIGLTDVASLNGGNITPIEAAELYSQTGNLLWSSRNYEGDRNPMPVTDIVHRISSDLQQYINIYNENLQMIYDSTGINRVRDGSQEQQRASVGGMNLALDMSNAATKNILNASLSILERVSENIITRFKQMSLLDNRFQDKLLGLIGGGNKKALEGGKYFHQFACEFNIEIEPDAKEKAAFQELLGLALNSQAIDITDSIDLKQTRNLKLANKYLKIKIENRQKKLRQQQREDMAYQQQLQTQSQMAIEQARQQAAQAEMQAKQLEFQLEVQKEQLIKSKELEAAIMLENLKFQHEMQLKQLDVQSNKALNQFKEDAKDNRTAIQANQQSRMINQRDKGGEPIDFESEAEMKQMMKQYQQGQDIQGGIPIQGNPLPSGNLPMSNMEQQQTQPPIATNMMM